MKSLLALAPLALSIVLLPARARAADVLRFQFGDAPAAPGFTGVARDEAFTRERGFGFEPAGQFTACVPHEGNYRVTVTLGDPRHEATTTIKAELRRLMVERFHTRAGKTAKVEFIVNTRTPRIAATDDIKPGEVRLKAPREGVMEAWAWDDALTLEFLGSPAAVRAVEIAAAEVPTVFLLGDSTVCDQPREPYNSWGQMLPRWFKPQIAIANHGESGETYRDSIGRRRLDKILSVMKPGDWVIMQFGHNDQKQIAAGTGSPATYRQDIRKHVEAIRAHGGTAVIVSPMERRNFNADGRVRPTLTEYADAARAAAQELGVAFLDLHAMSIAFYEALGPEKSARAFAAPRGKVDNTHHDNYGSYELSKCIVQAIRTQRLPLAKFVVDDFQDFDPAHPDDVDAFAVPASPEFTNQRPLGDDGR